MGTLKSAVRIVEYAMQFVGGRYVYGGVDPNRGVDCSGFTRYVLSNSASIALPHSSKGQSSYGKQVTVEEMQPGDLLFYSGSGGINHVALYIGDGKIVHASTERRELKHPHTITGSRLRSSACCLRTAGFLLCRDALLIRLICYILH